MSVPNNKFSSRRTSKVEKQDYMHRVVVNSAHFFPFCTLTPDILSPNFLFSFAGSILSIY